MDRRVLVRDGTEHPIQCDVGHPLDPTELPSPARRRRGAKRREHPGGPDDPSDPGGRSRLVWPLHRREGTGLRTAPGCQRGAVREPATDRAMALGRGESVRSDRDRIRLHRDHVVVRPIREEAGGARMNRDDGMNLIPLGFLGWLLCVTGAVIASLPQWFVVQVGRGGTAASSAIEAEVIGLPILFIGSLLLIIAWLPERKRKYPEILETTMTPIPKYYLEEAAKEA